jgi:hypothetical protein
VAHQARVEELLEQIKREDLERGAGEQPDTGATEGEDD